MNRFFRIITIAALVVTSCSRDVIDGDDLPKILADIYMTDRAILNSPLDIHKADSSLIYEPVLKKYGYTTEDLVYTFDYYLSRPLKLKSYFYEAKKILEVREMAVSSKLSAIYQRDSLLAPIRKIIEDRDSLRDLDTYERSLRWILVPDKYPNWHLYMPDSLKTRYELPVLEQWWINNLTNKQKSFMQYEKTRSPISLPSDRFTDPERLSLPEH